jgi:hypothetical protein
MKLLITTQVYENYGAHDWDGAGECPQYWKPKGGNEYVIRNFQGSLDKATKAVMAVRSNIELDTNYICETIIDWSIVQDDFLTDFELDQLKYEGRIVYPVTELTYS